jgi:hypothetical protein
MLARLLMIELALGDGGEGRPHCFAIEPRLLAILLAVAKQRHRWTAHISSANNLWGVSTRRQHKKGITFGRDTIEAIAFFRGRWSIMSETINMSSTVISREKPIARQRQKHKRKQKKIPFENVQQEFDV